MCYRQLKVGLRNVKEKFQLMRHRGQKGINVLQKLFGMANFNNPHMARKSYKKNLNINYELLIHYE